MAGRSLFITGPAGVGKSFCVDRVVAALQARGTRVAVTASTGIAGVLIGGSTIHSWAGIALGEGSVNEVVAKVLASKMARNRWRQHDAVVLDEISMIDGGLLEKLDEVGRAVRGMGTRHPDPFGGIQMIFVGDFFQLPPVAKESARAIFAFESQSWRAANVQVVELTEVFRQADPAHVSLLHRVRTGQADGEVAAAIERCRRPLRTDDGVLPTTLYPRRNDVRAENLHHFAKLPGAERMYTAVDTSGGGGGDAWFGTLDRDLQAYQHLRLKLDAQVMLLTNVSLRKGLCNGSRGVVVGFTDVGDYASAATADERAQMEHMSEAAAARRGRGSERTGVHGGQTDGGGGGGCAGVHYGKTVSGGGGGGEAMSDKDLFYAAMDPESRRFLRMTEAAGLGLPIVRFANGQTLTVKVR